jgi:ferritin-like metal-binding protein YciE
LDAMQTMLPEATSPQVKALLEKHIDETEQQITTLEQVFDLMGEKPKRIKCAGATGIVSENESLLDEVADSPELVDLAIAGGSAKVEHYEIAAYRSMVTGAQQAGQTQVAQLLQTILQQEEQTALLIEQSTPELYKQAMGRSAKAKA